MDKLVAALIKSGMPVGQALCVPILLFGAALAILAFVYVGTDGSKAKTSFTAFAMLFAFCFLTSHL